MESGEKASAATAATAAIAAIAVSARSTPTGAAPATRAVRPVDGSVHAIAMTGRPAPTGIAKGAAATATGMTAVAVPSAPRIVRAAVPTIAVGTATATGGGTSSAAATGRAAPEATRDAGIAPTRTGTPRGPIGRAARMRTATTPAGARASATARSGAVARSGPMTAAAGRTGSAARIVGKAEGTETGPSVRAAVSADVTAPASATVATAGRAGRAGKAAPTRLGTSATIVTGPAVAHRDVRTRSAVTAVTTGVAGATSARTVPGVPTATEAGTGARTEASGEKIGRGVRSGTATPEAARTGPGVPTRTGRTRAAVIATVTGTPPSATGRAVRRRTGLAGPSATATTDVPAVTVRKGLGRSVGVRLVPVTGRGASPAVTAEAVPSAGIVTSPGPTVATAARRVLSAVTIGAAAGPATAGRTSRAGRGHARKSPRWSRTSRRTNWTGRRVRSSVHCRTTLRTSWPATSWRPPAR